MIWALIATLLTVGISMYLILTILASLGGLTFFPLPIPLGVSINLGQWAKPELVDLGASIIGTLVLILLFRFFRRWIRYSALTLNWKYIRSLGWRQNWQGNLDSPLSRFSPPFLCSKDGLKKDGLSMVLCFTALSL